MTEQSNVSRSTDDNGSPYGPVEFSKPERVKPFTKFGKTGIVAANFRVPILAIPGLFISSAIFGSLVNTESGTEVTFEASLPSRALVCGGENADDVRAQFMEHVHTAAPLWNGYASAIDAAYGAITNTSRSTRVVPKLERPKLITQPANERPAAQPVKAPQIGKR